MRLTVEEFKKQILPGLRAQHKDGAALQKAIAAMIDGSEITDADGNPVMIEAINMESAPAGGGGGEGEGGGGASSGPSGNTGSSAGGSSGAAGIDFDDLATKAVAKALGNAAPAAPKPQFQFGGTKHSLPATAKRWGKLKHFKGDDADEQAYRFGQWALATLETGPLATKAAHYCAEHGIEVTKAQGETVNVSGGYTVPIEFAGNIIELVEDYGVFRPNAKLVPMARDTFVTPRRTGGLTAYFVGESGSGTESEKTWDNVTMVAKKIMTLTRYSSELAEDSMINIGDNLAGEIARAFAYKEDLCGFNGDGSHTYGGIYGAAAKLKGLTSGTTYTNIAGMQVAATTGGWTAIALTDFNGLIGKLPRYAQRPGEVAWYCSQAFFGSVMQKLSLAAGGNSVINIQDGALTQQFLGYPVQITQVMPSATATSDVCCLLGNLSMAADFGDRRQMTVAIDGSRYFDQDQLAIRGTERFDIVVHDVGNASATATSRVPGPILGLMTAAS